MKVSLIWAMADNRVIGFNNKLPWRLPADLQYFKKTTLGKPIVMGRKTFESFGSRPLPGRKNIIVTRDADYKPDQQVRVVSSIEDAMIAAGDVDEVMIIGGQQIYAQTLEYADRLYMTKVHGNFQGDAFFPEFDLADWKESQCEDFSADDKNPHDYSFILLERIT